MSPSFPETGDDVIAPSFPFTHQGHYLKPSSFSKSIIASTFVEAASLSLLTTFLGNDYRNWLKSSFLSALFVASRKPGLWGSRLQNDSSITMVA